MLDPYEALFDSAELARIFGYIAERARAGRSRKWLKYQAMFGILAGAGIRAGELCNLLGENIILDYDPPYIRVRRLKKKAVVWDRIPLADKAVERIRPYLQSGERGAGLLFKTRNEKPYCSRQVWAIWQSVLKGAGVRKRRLHALRHTLGTNMMETCKDIVACQHTLGHTDVRTTAKYYTDTRMKIQKAQLDEVARAGGMG